MFSTPAARIAWIPLALMLFGSPGVGAVTLYKSIDANGKVTYSEAPPIGFNGKVVPLEIRVETNPASLPKPDGEKGEKALKFEIKEGDYLYKRRAVRAALEARLAAARKGVDDAKAALASAPMEEDEFQVIMVPIGKTRNSGSNQPPGMPTETQSMRTDTKMCGQVNRNGRRVQACGRAVGNEKFVAKMDALEQDLKRAEEELTEAERAYRRSVD